MAFRKVKADLSRATGADFDVKMEAVKMYEGGKGCPAIASYFGVAQTSVRKWLTRSGAAIRGHAEAVKLAHPVDAGQAQEIVRRYLNNESTSSLAREFNVDTHTITARMNSMGVTQRSLANAQRLRADANPLRVEAIRLRNKGIGVREIGRRLGVSHPCIRKYLRPRGSDAP